MNIGYYSQEQANQFCAYYYQTPDGTTVLVTEVIPEGNTSNWPDAVLVGPVTKFLSKMNIFGMDE